MICWEKYSPGFALANSSVANFTDDKMTDSDKSEEYFFREGCHIQEWHNSAADTEMSVARVRVEPHSETKLHLLRGTTERYVILSGKGIVSVAGRSWPVGVGDVVVIEADDEQKINNNQSQELIFLAICTPRFEQKNYRQLED